MNVASVKTTDIANGAGVRTTMFVSGCTRACPGCFNEEAWDFEAGEPFDEAKQEEILETIEPSYIAGLTVLGGEPMEPENQKALAPFLKRFRDRFPNKNVWLYTGDTYEELMEGPHRTEVTDDILMLVDVLVDGPFVEDLHDITLRFRGSSNQRLIDLPRTRAEGHVVIWDDGPLFSQRGSMEQHNKKLPLDM